MEWGISSNTLAQSSLLAHAHAILQGFVAIAEPILPLFRVRSSEYSTVRRMDNGGWQAVDFTKSILPFLIFR